MPVICVRSAKYFCVQTKRKQENQVWILDNQECDLVIPEYLVSPVSISGCLTSEPSFHFVIIMLKKC